MTIIRIDCLYAECHYAKSHIFLIVILNVIMLCVVMLSVVTPREQALSLTQNFQKRMLFSKRQSSLLLKYVCATYKNKLNKTYNLKLFSSIYSEQMREDNNKGLCSKEFTAVIYDRNKISYRLPTHAVHCANIHASLLFYDYLLNP